MINIGPTGMQTDHVLCGANHGRPPSGSRNFAGRFSILAALFVVGVALNGCATAATAPLSRLPRMPRRCATRRRARRQQRRDFAGAVAKFNDAVGRPNSAGFLATACGLSIARRSIKVVADFPPGDLGGGSWPAARQRHRFYARMYGGLANEYIGDYRCRR